MERGTFVPCNARVADGAIRGALVGALWGAFGPSEQLGGSLTPTVRGKVVPSSMLHQVRYGVLSTLSFSCFFGLYSGLLCSAERAFGTDSIVCPVIAGGAIGSAIGTCLPPPRAPNILVCGGVTAAVSAVSAWTLSSKRR